MTPLDLAQSLATDERTQSLAVAMLARGLADDDGLRQGWPLPAAVEAAARYLDLEPSAELVAEAERIAPTISDAMLNRAPR